ncbi:hypothetical protein ABLO03_07735, partial [Mycobacterium tuberculosis]
SLYFVPVIIWAVVNLLSLPPDKGFRIYRETLSRFSCAASTELIKPGKPWRSIEDVELATARWVDWFNHRRLYQYCGDVPPVELEAAYYAQRQRPAAG